MQLELYCKQAWKLLYGEWNRVVWIIGDIHGCKSELDQLLTEVPSRDSLIFLGDYIDRGPDSRGVIERVLSEASRSVFLMGNHERMMLDHFHNSHDRFADWWLSPENGGMETLHSYGLKTNARWRDLPRKHRDFLENLATYHEELNFVAVHAGVNPHGPIEISQQHPEDLLWIRGNWILHESDWAGKLIYFGHTPTRYFENQDEASTPVRRKRSIALDTGCVYGGALTAMEHPSGRVISIPSSHSWHHPMLR